MFGGSDSLLAVTISGGIAPYTATVSNGITSLTQVVPGTGFEVAGLQSGVWRVKLVDKNNCTDEDLVTIPAANQFYIQSAVITPISCMGAHDATIALTIVGGAFPFEYSIDSGAPVSSDNPTFIFVDIGPGPHIIGVRDKNSCSLIYITPFIIDPGQLALTSTTTPPLCVGQATGSIIVQASGGTSPYEYSIDDGATFQVSNEFTQVTAGTYTVLVEDAHACKHATAIVPAAPAIVIQSVATSGSICFGGANGSRTITATGGTGTLTYSIDGGATFTISNVFTQLSAGPYFIVVRDSQGCRATTTATLTQPSQLSVAVVTKTVCPGGNTITVTASGGVPPYTYSINGGISFTTADVFTNLRSGVYSVVVKDSN